MGLKRKTELKDLLYHEGYDKIAIWKNGDWANVGIGYVGEQEGDQPACFIRRNSFYNVTKKQVNEKIKEIEHNCL